MILHEGSGLVDGVDDHVAIGFGELALQADVEDLGRVGPVVLGNVDGQVVNGGERYNPEKNFKKCDWFTMEV